MKIGGHEIEISNRDKVFFPDEGHTKGDVIDYYDAVAETMVPHTKRYGASMQRFPDGLADNGFYNKDTPDYFPDWVTTFEFPRREGGSFRAPVVDSRATLVYMANQAVLTPHLYLSRSDDLEHPDKMIYDLDPPGDSRDFAAVRQAALDVRSLMQELDLPAWVQTSGSKGYHIIVALRPEADFDTVRQFAHDSALVLVRRHPDKYTLQQRKKKRKGRIFLDMLRNSYGATAVSPYAIRPREGAPVATPLDWEEVEEGTAPRHWNIENVPRRLAQKEDPWAGMMSRARSLTKRREKLDELLENEEPAAEEN